MNDQDLAQAKTSVESILSALGVARVVYVDDANDESVSVEDVIAEHACRLTGAKETKFHSSGREDVDVLMKGQGRPFVLELVSPSSKVDLALLESLVKKSGTVEILGLKLAERSMIEIVSESSFDKQYFAKVSLSRKALQEDVEKLNSLSPLKLFQRTPQRVSHRRADLVRERTVKNMRASLDGEHIMLDLKTEAGTYIKEFVSGDSGRTSPSISGILGCDAVFIQLDVMHIYDDFLRCCID